MIHPFDKVELFGIFAVVPYFSVLSVDHQLNGREK